METPGCYIQAMRRDAVEFLAKPFDHQLLLTHTAAFYQLELHRYPEGIQYLAERGVHDAKLIEELGIGYARGGNLRPHLQALGYCLERLPEAGLMGPKGPDTLCRRVIFPCRQQDPIVNLYGRSMGNAFPHRLLPHWPVNRPSTRRPGPSKEHRPWSV
jgi:hypothetical protein